MFNPYLVCSGNARLNIPLLMRHSSEWRRIGKNKCCDPFSNDRHAFSLLLTGGTPARVCGQNVC